MIRSWKSILLLIWLSQFFAMAAFSSAYTFIPFYLKHIGVPGDRLSWYVALFSASGNLSFAIASPIWGMIADIYGRRPMLLRANFAAALLIPLMGLITNPDLLIVHRFVLGAMAGTVTASQTLILSTTPGQNRSFALGAIASALFSGMMVGQFLGGDVVNYLGFRGTFFLGGALLAIAGGLVLLVHEKFTRPARPLEQIRRGFAFRLPRFGKVWYLMLLFVSMSLARDFDGPFVPVLVDDIVKDNALALRWSGHISGFCSAAAILSGLSLGFLADRVKLITVLLAAILIAGLLRLPQAMA
ncbi:MAG: MFS transporter, partial [Victivallaceae bacterium]